MIELCQNFVTQEYQPQLLKFFDLSTLPIRLRQEETLAIEYLAKDGNWHLARFIVKRRNNEGEVTNVLYVTRLISDQKRRERNWISAAKEAERANQAKSDLLSRMAHDIRTPLNAIMGFCDIASSSVNDPQKVSDSLEHIRIAGSYLQQLVNDILDIAAIENHHLQLHPAPMQLSSVYDLLSSIFTQMAEKKQIQLEFRLHDLDTNNLMADELRLRQIYANLLSNAIKYTPDGGHVTFELFLNSPEILLQRCSFMPSSVIPVLVSIRTIWGKYMINFPVKLIPVSTVSGAVALACPLSANLSI